MVIVHFLFGPLDVVAIADILSPLARVEDVGEAGEELGQAPAQPAEAVAAVPLQRVLVAV